jgi:hypothetical protein
VAFKKYPLVLIDWIDPWSKGGWSDNPEEVNEAWQHNFACQSVGWLVKEDKEKVMLAASRTANDSQIGDLFLIPRRCINKITELQPTSPVPLQPKAIAISKKQ